MVFCIYIWLLKLVLSWYSDEIKCWSGFSTEADYNRMFSFNLIFYNMRSLKENVVKNEISMSLTTK